MKKEVIKPTIVKNEEKPEADELIAASIIELAEGMRRMSNGPLRRRAIIVLLRGSTGVSLHEIQKVLDGIESLASDYTKKSTK